MTVRPCPRCGGATYADMDRLPVRDRCRACDAWVTKAAGRPPWPRAAIEQARLLLSEASDRCTLHGEPAVWIRASDLKIILDALDPQC